jgi:nitroreductase
MTMRQTATKLDPLFLERWSPRAFDGAPIPEEDLAAMFDAARFAPSSFNHQPWRLLYALRGDENWDRFLSFLIPTNLVWAQNASVMFYIASDRYFTNERPSRVHSFDAGGACAMLAMQATMLGYHCHAMAGFDVPAATESLGIPDNFELNCAMVIGRIGDPATLSEALQAREHPSGRKPLEEIAYRGNFRG